MIEEDANMDTCPKCNSWDIEQRSKWDGGMGKCNECGAEFTWDEDANHLNATNYFEEKKSSYSTKNNELTDFIKVDPIDNNSLITCPRCGSTQISADKKGFSVGKAVAGVALAGGVGVVAGGIGAKKVIVTCLNCGKQWKAGKQ